MHYKKNKLISALFLEDKQAMHKLPEVKFEVFKLITAKADNCGMVSYDNRFYSTSPRYMGKKVWIKASAHQIIILDQDYQKIHQHRRLYGKQIESMEWIPYLELMSKRPTALKYTGFFKELPQTLQDYLDECSYQEKKVALTTLNRMIKETDLETAENAFKDTISLGLMDIDSIYATYYRMINKNMKPGEIKFDANLPELKPYIPDNTSYDILLQGGEIRK